MDPNITGLLQREHPRILAGIGVRYREMLIFDASVKFRISKTVQEGPSYTIY